MSGLFTSWATPETSWPTAAIFSVCISLACSMAASVISVMTTTMLFTLPGSSRMGLRLTENCPPRPCPEQHRQLQVVHLAAGQGFRQGIDERLPPSGRDQFHQLASEQVFLGVTAGFKAALVGVADEPGGIDHQDHALRVVQDLVVEVALALQFGLEVLHLGDVEHQAAILHHLVLAVADGEGILQGVDERAVLAAQRLLVVAHHALGVDLLHEVAALVRLDT